MSRYRTLTVGMASLLAIGAAPTWGQQPPGPDDPPPPDRPVRERLRELGRFRPAEREPAARGAWLGVQLTPVPAAVAAHLGLDEQGLMIRNVFRGSAADQAGLQRFDVIVEADGNPVSPEVEAFSRHVRGKQPGEPLELTLIREGQPQPMSLLVGESPARTQRMELKYPEDDPDVLAWRDFGLRGKILRPGPGGWIVEDLGELPDMDRFLWFRERGLDRDATDAPVDVDEGRRVGRDGRVLHVRRQADGSIEVRRFRSGEDETMAEVRTYPGMDELREADPEAHELLQSVRRHRLPMAPGFGRDRRVRPSPPDIRLPDRDPRWREWRERFFQAPLREPPRAPGPPAAPDALPPPAYPIEAEPPPVEPEPAAPPEPRVRFQVDPDGAITVHLRQDDAEMQTRFRSREALQRRAPELYQRFEQMERQVR